MRPLYEHRAPNLAPIWMQLNPGESFLKGMKTVRDMDLADAEEARLREKNELDNLVTRTLLPLKVAESEATIKGTLALAGLRAAQAKTSADILESAVQNNYGGASDEELFRRLGLDDLNAAPTQGAQEAQPVDLDNLGAEDDSGGAFGIDDLVGDEDTSNPLYNYEIDQKDLTNPKYALASAPGAMSTDVPPNSEAMGVLQARADDDEEKLLEAIVEEDFGYDRSGNRVEPQAQNTVGSQITRWNEALRRAQGLPARNKVERFQNASLAAELQTRLTDRVSSEFGIPPEAIAFISKGRGGLPRTADEIDRIYKTMQTGGAVLKDAAGADRYVPISSWDQAVQAVEIQNDLGNMLKVAEQKTQDPAAVAKSVTEINQAIEGLRDKDGNIPDENLPAAEKLYSQLASHLGTPTGTLLFADRFRRIQDKSSKLGMAAENGIAYGGIAPEQAPAELARLNEQMVALAVEKSPFFGGGDREKMRQWLSNPVTRNLPFVTTVQTDFFTGNAPLFPTEKENVYKIWAPKDKSWKLLDLSEKPKEAPTSSVNISEVAFIDEPSDNPLTREEFLAQGDAAARQMANAPLLPKKFTAAVGESLRNLPWGFNGVIPTGAQRRLAQRESEMNRVSPEQRMVELRNRVSELDKKITKMGPSTSQEYRVMVRERNQAASMLNEIIRRETSSSSVL